MHNHNVFAGAFVDRSGERRKDNDWIQQAAADASSRFVPVWRRKCLLQGDPPQLAMLPHAAVAGVGVEADDLVFLGIKEQQNLFALTLDDSAPPGIAEAEEFHDLRFMGTALPPDQANVAAHAHALILWHKSQRYCGHCGQATMPDAAGNARKCIDESCGNVIFPRVDPAIIVLVENGDRCLLGRQSSWPEGRYSTIAGFVEPGESLEDAVRREVFEETNIRVGEVRYHSSQPWPFPSSLMLGFHAQALSDDIRLNDGELEDARWFTRTELAGDFPKLPFRISIARRLVDSWINGVQDWPAG